VVVTASLLVDTQGHTDIVNITRGVSDAVAASELTGGIVTVFCPGSTGAITTVEFEDGVVADIQRALDQLAPPDGDYLHHLRWGDDNGHSHVRAALVGPSLTIPFIEGRLSLGTWQQIVLIDCDTRARSRRLVVQVMGE
jgi:secondary thiamine-phosphate synthase enzyme